jgi:hypothetical protein
MLVLLKEWIYKVSRAKSLGAMTHIPGLIKIGSGVQKLIGGNLYRPTDTYRQKMIP